MLIFDNYFLFSVLFNFIVFNVYLVLQSNHIKFILFFYFHIAPLLISCHLNVEEVAHVQQVDVTVHDASHFRVTLIITHQTIPT